MGTTMTLLLNQAYEPIGTISLKRAVSKLARGVAEVVEWYRGDLVYTSEHDLDVYDVARFGALGRWFDEELVELNRVKVSFERPAVIREMSPYRHKPPQFSRVNIFLRDGYECQYEGCRTTKQFLKRNGTPSLPASMLTFDHVLPQSRGGLTAWNNIVTCCRECNNVKDNSTPEEAGMVLRRLPAAPRWLPFTKTRVNTPDEWRNWLYWHASLKA